MVTTKANMTRLIASTMLIALLSAFMVSVVLAAPDGDSAQTTVDDNPQAVGDDQMLYASEDNATTTDDSPVLIQQRDNTTNTTDSDSSADFTEDTQSEDNPPLIAPQPTSDNAATVIVSIAALTAIAVGASVAVILFRKK